MKFKNVVIEQINFITPPSAWSSDFIEEQLTPIYERLKLPKGRLELMSGIQERHFWNNNILPSQASALAGEKVLKLSGIDKNKIDLLIHSSVCRDRLEPATAAYIHEILKMPAHTQFFDLSNACLGFLNAMIVAAGLIESGQMERVLICSGENGKPLVENTIKKLNSDLSLTRNSIKSYFANLTIGAGAVAAILTRKDLSPKSPQLLGGVLQADTISNKLCEGDTSGDALVMQTDSEKLLHAGIHLATQTWEKLKAEMNWTNDTPDKIITHQVGTRHSSLLFEALKLDTKKDYRSFHFLGNVGSVSLPGTLALAIENKKIMPGDKVALLGIGSGLSSLMLAISC